MIGPSFSLGRQRVWKILVRKCSPLVQCQVRAKNAAQQDLPDPESTETVGEKSDARPGPDAQSEKGVSGLHALGHCYHFVTTLCTVGGVSPSRRSEAQCQKC